MELWQWHCRNRREKNLFQLVCGNAIAEIEGKKCGNEFEQDGKEKLLFVAMALLKQMRDIKKVRIFLFFQYFFLLKQFGLSRSSMTKKKVKWNCGNDIAEIGGKKIYFSWFLAIPLPKLREKKKLVGMNLWQWHY